MPEQVGVSVTLGPRYRALTLLAKGGMGAVYLGQHLVEENAEPQVVAIKVMHAHIADHPDTVAMFIDEARIGTRIVHPNVVRVLDTDVADDTPFIVMEYIEGISFSRLLQNMARAGERVPVEVVACIIHDALVGLHAAHLIGAIHRDVSPHNVIVGADGRSRITDFGVATFTGRLSTTAPGVVRGKLGYMSPEQVARTGVAPRSDVFAAGIVLWEALTGRDLFACESPADTLAKVLREPIPPPSAHAEVPEALEDVCLKALERQVERRYESAEEFAKAIAAAVPLATGEVVAALVARHGAESLERQSSVRAAMAFQPGFRPRAETQQNTVTDAIPASRTPARGRTLSIIAFAAAALVLVVLGTIIGRISGRGRTVASSSVEDVALSPMASASGSGPVPILLPDSSGVGSLSTSAASAPSSAAPTASPSARGLGNKVARPRPHSTPPAASAHPPAAPSSKERKPDGPFIPGEL
jgi:serine/threonine-protein kinase